jgi:hypothetical protein
MRVSRRSTSLMTPEYSWARCSPGVPFGGGCSGSSVRSYFENLDTSGLSPDRKSHSFLPREWIGLDAAVWGRSPEDP